MKSSGRKEKGERDLEKMDDMEQRNREDKVG